MAIAMSLLKFLNSRSVPYDLVAHPRTTRAAASANASGVSGDELAKGVLVKYANGYLLAIVPASRQVSLEAIAAVFERPVSLATESELPEIFTDCELGAVPALSEAYGIEAVMDECLEEPREIYFEGGDHRSLIHVNGRVFTELMAGVLHAHISEPEMRQPKQRQGHGIFGTNLVLPRRSG